MRHRRRCCGGSLCLLALAAAGCLETPPGSQPAAVDAAAVGPDAAAESPGRIDRESAPRVPIPDNDPTGVNDPIEVAAACTVEVLTVDIDIRHGWRSDVEVTLHEPGGEKARLHAAGGNDSHDDIVGTYPVTLSPLDSLDSFVGLPAAGSWVMQVADLSSDDIGSFESWALHIECR